MKYKMHRFLLLLLFLMFNLPCCFSSSSIFINNRTINAVTYYKISLLVNKSSSVQTGKLTIQFPSPGYTNSLLSGSSCSSYTCSVSALNISIPSFTMTSGQETIQITINSITNPGSTLASSNRTIFISIQTNHRNYNTTISLGVFDAGTLQSCELTFWNNIVNTNSSGQLEIKTKNKVSNGKISLTIPSSWNYSADDAVDILNDSAKCQSGGTSLNCSFTDFWTTSYLQIKNLTISGGATYKLNISNFMTPPVSALNTQLSASTSDAYSNLIDNQVSCKIVALNLKKATLSSSTPTALIQSDLNPSISFLNPDVIKTGDVLQITVSNLITVVNVSSLLFNTSSKNYSFPLISSTTYRYSIQFDSSSPVLQSLNSVVLSGLKFKTLSYSKSISSALLLTLSRSGYDYMTLQVDAKVTPKTLTNKSLSSSQSIVQKSGTFTLTFRSLTPLIQSSSIIINIPTSLSGVNCINQITINTTTYTTINCNYVAQVITITNIPVSLSSNTSISVKFNATNPLTTQPITLKVTTIYNNSIYNSSSEEGISDTGSVQYTPTSASPASITITPGNYRIGDTSKYTINYRTSSLLPINSSIIINIPQQLLPIITSVNVSINTSATFNSTYTINSQTLTLTNINLNASIPSNSIINIQINSLKNSHNFTTTSSFALTSTNNNYSIEYVASGLTVTMNTSTAFNSVSVVPNSKRNGQSTVYSILLNSSINIKSGYILVISIPSSVSLVSPQCLTSQTVCSLSNNNLSITINTNINYNQVKNISVSGFVNPRTYSPTGTFRFYLYNSLNLYQQSDFAGFSNSQPNSIISFSKTHLIPNQSFLNSSQSIRFFVVTYNRVSMIDNQYFQLTIPDGYSIVNSVNCDPNYLCSLSNESNKVINVRSSNPSQTIFQFVIHNLRTPINLQGMQNQTNTYFYISSYTSNNTIIDTTSSNTRILFELSCNINCQTCDTANTSYCLSCYQSATLFNNQCLTCLPGYYKNSTSDECQQCNSNCKTCVVTPVTCTSCQTDLFLNSVNSTCVLANQCPLRTFPRLGQCRNCSSTCLSCQNTSTTCITCADNYFKRTKNSSECVLNCDAGLLKFDGVCQCSVCLTCSNLITNCTSCDPESSNKYLHNNLCLEKCPPTMYGSGTTCLRCMEGCNVCSATQCFDEIENSLTGKLIPVPFTLCAIIVIVLGVLSKIIYSQTYIPSFVVSIGSMLEVICWIVLLGIMRYFETTKYRIIGQILIASGIGLNYLLNISHAIIFWKYLMGDKAFSFWFRRQTSKMNKVFTIIISVITSHRYSHILFSRAFNSQNLRGCLDNSLNIIPIYINTGIGFIAQVLVIAGCALIAYDPRTYSRGQLYMQCIDSVVINILIIICTSWNFIKPEGFFKPVEINKYQTRQQFKNNQTIENLNDNYLDNMEIEQVVGGLGGRSRYKNTRLHLQGLDEKALHKNKRRVVSGLIAQIVGEDQESLIENKLVKKVNSRKNRLDLDGISQSNEDLDEINIEGESNDENNYQRKQKGRKVRGPFSEDEGQRVRNSKRRDKRKYDDQQSELSISKDSLVRYQNPLDFQQADIVFASKPNKNNVFSGSNKQHKEGENINNNSNEQNFKLNQVEYDGQDNFNQQNNSGEEYYYNEYGEIVDENGNLYLNQQNYKLGIPQGFDQQQVPHRPMISQSHEYSTNLDHINSHSSNFPPYAIQTSYSPKGIKNSLPFKRIQRMKQSFNRTQAKFRKKNSFDSQQDYSQQPPIFNTYSNKKLEVKGQINSQLQNNPNLPYHQFQRYLDDDFVSNFEHKSNQLTQKRELISSSVGSIRRNKKSLPNVPVLTEQDISRQVISQSILAPETPIRIPRLQTNYTSNQLNSVASVTQPLEVISEHQSHYGLLKKEPTPIPLKLNSTSKIYLQKLRINNNKSKKQQK